MAQSVTERRGRQDRMSINSLIFFRSHWIVWKMLGVLYKKVEWKKLYLTYSLIMNLLISIGYPLHLGLSLFNNANFADDLKNLSTFFTIVSCVSKFAIYIYNFEKVEQMEQLLKQLDSRISGEAEKAIYSQLKQQLRNILFIFMGIYIPIGAFAELSFAFQKERQLMYPAWFPFDWANSTRNFYIAHLYQIVGISFLLMQNYVNDCFPAVVLCLISAHIKMLYKRFERIGQNNSGDAESNKELDACITDHKNLLELFQLMESFMSLPMFIQFGVTSFNFCSSIAAALFLVTDPTTRAYFLLYGVGIAVEIFPICYYGMDIELWLGQLHYAAFSSNWIVQNRSYKKKMMIFVENSLKQKTAMAGGMMRIHVDTFFATMKFAYSLLTILLNMGI